MLAALNLAVDTVSEADRKRHSRRHSTTLVALLSITMAIALAEIGRRCIGFPVRVVSNSMSPTIKAGDWLLVSPWRASNAKSSIQRGDTIVFHLPFDSPAQAVKRVVATAGDHVEVDEQSIRVNGTALRLAEGPRASLGPPVHSDRSAPIVDVPPGYVYVIGDNSSTSLDSRFFGPVPKAAVLGVVQCVLIREWRPTIIRVSAER
jgi:signal peptidase I